jgi:site-specific recombinase XerD
VKGVRRLGVRLGNWLTAEQGRRLVHGIDPMTLRGLRDHAMVALLLGCGLRRGEALALALESIQQREEHWVIADLVGKGGHIRTVPMPAWVKTAVDAWTRAAGLTHGRVFRAINKAGRVWGDGMTAKVIWDVVRRAPPVRASTSWHPTISGEPVPDCAIWPAANSIKSSFSSGMSRFRRRNAISAASRSCGAP